MSSFKKRVQFTKQEELEMWQFFIEKIKKRDIDAKKFDYKIWREFKTNLEKKNCSVKHTYVTIAKHFIRQMLPKLAQSPLSNEEIDEILKCCELKFLRVNREAFKNLENRLGCKLKLDALNHVHKINLPISNKKNIKNNSNVSNNCENLQVYDLPQSSTSKQINLSPNRTITSAVLSSQFKSQFTNSTFETNENLTLQNSLINFVNKNQTENNEKEEEKSNENSENNLVLTNNECFNLNFDKEIDCTADLFMTEELQSELLYYQTLCKMHEDNGGIEHIDTTAMKELVILRAKLILQKIMPFEQLFEKIPEEFQQNLQNFSKILYWCVSNEENFS